MSERKAGRARNRSAEENEHDQDDATEGTEATSGRVKTTLADQGPRLPIGILDGTALHKEIVTKRWTTKEERELGELMRPDANMSEHVSIVVANMCSKLGPHNLDAMKPEQKAVAISTMYMGDVFYAYAWLRKKTMGNKLRLEISCPRARCGVQFPYTGLLDTIEVIAVEDIDDILWAYKLEEPIKLRKKEVTHFQMAYPKWTVMEQAKGTVNEADVKAMTIQGTIVGLNDDQEPVALTMSEIDELSKIDFEQIQEGINDHFLGPKMGIEGVCEKSVCTTFRTGGFKFVFPINWGYKDFFGASSR
jgi:hypothetical protein